MTVRLSWSVFVASATLLLLEILASRVLSIVFGPPTVYYTVSVAMLGTAVAGAWVCLRKEPPTLSRAGQEAAWAMLGAAVSVLVLFFAAARIKSHLNGLPAATLDELVAKSAALEMRGALAIGALMSLPFFFIGVAHSVVFSAALPERIASLYSFDLFGAAAGCVLAVALLELGGFAPPLAFVVGLAFCCAGLYSRSQKLLGVCLALAASSSLLLLPKVAESFEPRPDLRKLSRSMSGSVTELWHTWTALTRVAALRIEEAGGTRYVMAHEEGRGHATIVPYDPGSLSDPDEAVELALAACPRNSVLVLLAGAGWDMIQIDAALGGRARITGVELLPQVVDWPRSQTDFHLAEFFDKPNIELVIDEARGFLARDARKFDCIVVSWTGAGYAAFGGVLTEAMGFLYTRQGVAQLIDHLAPGGQLTVLNTNKLKLAATVREVLDSTLGPGRASDAMAVVSGATRAWWDPHDQSRILIKPHGFSDADLTRIAAGESGRFLYAPRHSQPGNPYYDLLHADDPVSVLEQNPLGLRLLPDGDERPFVYDLLPPSAYLWPRLPTELDRLGFRADFEHKVRRREALAAFAGVAVILILGPLLLRRFRGIRRAEETSRAHVSERVKFLLLFFGAGSGFMMVELGLLQKLELLVGRPGQSLAVGLGGLIVFTGLGSRWSTRAAGRGIRGALVLAALGSLGSLFALDLAKATLLGSEVALRMLGCVVALAPAGFGLGLVFPRGLSALSASDSSLVPWALAVNSVAAVLAAGFNLPISHALGFDVAIALGAAIYLGLAVIPFGTLEVHRKKKE
ncbi:MAG: hypothetical protein HY791_19730 [Deltaproteobacteria bacterium]|nr:hypothetical protein [Deltaproteobacteria bacterium]